ncbi:2Fe-2S iron-sulfur cluster binding domain-containing protein [Cupriavidus gilardii]|uniref:2Fe-2S iron-sulfur cluster-binding protein n=1 Tax=Cupriavidus gilardii TaxID=82541 RepID=UPI001EE552F4|nr:2Fe-2S iron-sulfur cluster-binding protein [Cupriavidus gilardii]MCG5262124.1 2Fe-2S iron-sulfur cluster-binding protein [Cupriavidus gilardii]MDF9430256.1 2Fe-2S iron-sulfur cluster binding domain-containing protein [Cupriavidus gilardii]
MGDRNDDTGTPRLSRRAFLGTTVAAGGITVLPATSALAQTAGAAPSEPVPATAGAPNAPVTLTVNGKRHRLALDVRTSLLDALRETLHLTGTKKGCDHGQCGACTVLLNGRRINSCLTLAVMHQQDEITTIEGLERNGLLHPVQAAFIAHDGFQCGFCTPGQICSAVGMLREVADGVPSHASADLSGARTVSLQDLSEAEVRERMSGNLCRCSAYPNIVAAIRSAAGSQR